MRQRQTSWEQQRLYSIKNPLMGKTIGNPYGNRGVPAGNGQSSSTYSTGDGLGSEYMDSLASYKRNSTRPGSRSNVMSKSRQQVPPDGASSLNPPRSPRFSDRYKNSRDSPHVGVGGATTAVDSTHDWYDPKDAAESVGSGFSRGSGRSARSGYSGTSWSSRKSRNSEDVRTGAQL